MLSVELRDFDISVFIAANKESAKRHKLNEQRLSLIEHIIGKVGV